MDTRSTNYGYASPNDIQSNVRSSHGVWLTGGTTGGQVTASGDDANISLRLTGKGTGFTRVGNSSSLARIANSTTGISAIERYVVEFTPPVLTSNTAGESTYTVTGLTTNAGIISLTPRASYSTNYTVHSPRCSTADELVVVWRNTSASTIGNGESTNRWTVLATKF